MPVLQWSESLSVGVAEIDKQHQELIARINGLLAAMQRGQGRDELSPVLQFLESYVVAHFTAEEKLMRQHGYPGYAEQKALHDAFIADFTLLKGQFESEGATSALAIQVQRRVCDWTIKHIGEVDKRLGVYLKMPA
jgi:hemerythrin